MPGSNGLEHLQLLHPSLNLSMPTADAILLLMLHCIDTVTSLTSLTLMPADTCQLAAALLHVLAKRSISWDITFWHVQM